MRPRDVLAEPLVDRPQMSAGRPRDFVHALASSMQFHDALADAFTRRQRQRHLQIVAAAGRPQGVESLRADRPQDPAVDRVAPRLTPWNRNPHSRTAAGANESQGLVVAERPHQHSAHAALEMPNVRSPVH